MKWIPILFRDTPVLFSLDGRIPKGFGKYFTKYYIFLSGYKNPKDISMIILDKKLDGIAYSVFGYIISPIELENFPIILDKNEQEEFIKLPESINEANKFGY